MGLFLLIGVVFGLTYNHLKTPYFETSAITTSGLSYFEGIVDPAELEYPIIDQKIAVDMVNALGEIVQSNEYELFARVIGVSVEVAKTVKWIEAEQLYELDLENRRQKQSQFKITIRVLDNQSIKIVQEGLINYFNKNLYSNKNYSLFTKQTPELIAYLNQEISDVKEYRSLLKNKSNVELSSVSIANDDSELMQNEIVQLFERKQDLERDLELLKPISFVSNFPVYKQPKSRLLVRLGIFICFFLFMGFVLAIFREVKKLAS
ncbi:MAG: hypothetical protein CMP75_04345 [Flavobacteriales bacterium]|nr:hypothetical protein [Flavobacteriales bacterium]